MTTNRQSYSVNLGLPSLPETENQEIFSALIPLYNSIRTVMSALDAYTGNQLVTKDEFKDVNPAGQLLVQKQCVLYVKATETITAGNVVNLYNSSGLAVRKATASTPLPPRGVALASAVTGETIPVCLFGLITGYAGLVPGSVYYLSDTAGNMGTTAGTTSYTIGYAISTSQLWFSPGVAT